MGRRATRAIAIVDAAGILGVGEGVIERLCRDDVLPHIGIEGRWLIPLAAFDQFMQSGTEGARARYASYLGRLRDAAGRVAMMAAASLVAFGSSPALTRQHILVADHIHRLIPF